MKPMTVTNWDELYENAATRKLKKLAWVPIPNSSDSLGFLRMREEKDFSDIYTGWILILATASRCSSRGVLMSSDGRPYTADDLELKWRFPAKKFQRSIDFCSKLGWISGNPSENKVPLQSPEVLGGSPDVPGDDPDEVGRRAGAKERKNERKEKKESNSHFLLGREEIFIPGNLQSDGFADVWSKWIQFRKEIKHPLTVTQAEQTLKSLSSIGMKRAMTMILFTIEKGWRGLKEPEGRDAARIISSQESSPDTSLDDLRAKMGGGS